MPLGCHHQDELILVIFLFLCLFYHIETTADVLVKTLLGRTGVPEEYYDMEESEAPGPPSRMQARSLAQFTSSPCHGWQRDRTKPGLAEGAQQDPHTPAFPSLTPRGASTNASRAPYSVLSSA